MKPFSLWPVYFFTSKYQHVGESIEDSSHVKMKSAKISTRHILNKNPSNKGIKLINVFIAPLHLLLHHQEEFPFYVSVFLCHATVKRQTSHCSVWLRNELRHFALERNFRILFTALHLKILQCTC